MSKRTMPTSSSPSRTSGEKKIKINTSEVQMLVMQEVRSAVKETETKLESLIEKVQQQMEIENNYESDFRKLEAHINKLKRKGDKAFAYIMKLGINGTRDNMQKKSSLSSPATPAVMLDLSRSGSEDEIMEPAPHVDNNIVEDKEVLFQTMDSTKKALKNIRENTEAVKVTIADLSKKSLLLSHSDSPVLPQCTLPSVLIKTESADHQVEKVEQKAESTKVEQLSDNDNGNLDPTDKVKVELTFPPLPAMPFPSVLSMEAASFNIPQRLTLQLALIRKPPGLSVLWNVEKEDSSAPPMDSYSIFMTVEKIKGSNIFPEWKVLGEVRAIPLPMCVIISRYKPGYKACFAVVGKDKFGRYGPYSKVVPATIPH